MKNKKILIWISVLIFAVSSGISLKLNFKNESYINEQTAISIVTKIPEVIDFENLLKSKGKNMEMSVKDEKYFWVVHVYETVKDNDSTSHTATFGWYDVDKKTGFAKNELDLTTE